MAITAGYIDFVIEQLEKVPSVTKRSMFGGVGLYSAGYFFALMAEDRLYLKVDDSNRPDFERAGMEPFRPYNDDRSMQYYEVPVDVLEDADELKTWAEKAIDVSRRVKMRKKPKKRP